MELINPFQSNVLFLHPLKTSEKLLSSGLEKENWLKMGLNCKHLPQQVIHLIAELISLTFFFPMFPFDPRENIRKS